MYVALCGIDGCGKSTARQAVVDWLEGNLPTSEEIVFTREPGGTPTAEALRSILLDKKELGLDTRTQMLLMTAGRGSTLNQVVAPCLDNNQHVVSDRCYLSTVAYQCLDKDLEKLFVDLHLGLLMPDAIVLLDVDADEADSRIDKRGNYKDAIEEKGVQFQREVRERYLKAAESNPFILRVSSSGSPEETYQNVMDGLTEAFLEHAPLSIVGYADTITYNGKDGKTTVSKDAVERQLVGLGYEFYHAADGTFCVIRDGDILCDGLLNAIQPIKFGLSDALRRGLWNGISDAS